MEMLGLRRFVELGNIASASSRRVAGSTFPRRTPRPWVTKGSLSEPAGCCCGGGSGGVRGRGEGDDNGGQGQGAGAVRQVVR
ncbi:hypothetical protein ACP70R_039206 [Stipagrostis hirtigluma subsp. patula]